MFIHEQLTLYIQNGLISEVAHPEDENVRIYNYTPKCQFERVGDDVTRKCRGLILNVSTGEVLAQPFPKFFNYQEHITKSRPIPNEPPIVSEKLDGSLGILYQLNIVLYIAMRGSLMSDQAVGATQWGRDHLSMLPGENETHLFEITYSENRIVVNYDFTGLVYLAMLHTQNGTQIYRHWGKPITGCPKYTIPAPLMILRH